MDEQRLAEIEARANAATEGPWKYDPEPSDSVCLGQPAIIGAGGHIVFCENGRSSGELEDFDWPFITNARQDVPDLIAEVRRLRELLWVSVFCGGCGKRYTYNRADDPKGEIAGAEHSNKVPECQSNRK